MQGVLYCTLMVFEELSAALGSAEGGGGGGGWFGASVDMQGDV